ncbi:hypothetical protein N752_28135 [Desulforamulus aquiferis]|nr:hypothetical protein [Desulforamulus aquiferis]RYD01844.1 hypothetical protein N752_28135 [Desulforamulus aquiferis]
MIDEMEDLLIKDLLDLGYTGKELETKLLERKSEINNAFDRLIKERLREETVPFDEAIRSIKNDDI